MFGARDGYYANSHILLSEISFRVQIVWRSFCNVQKEFLNFLMRSSFFNIDGDYLGGLVGMCQISVFEQNLGGCF